MSTEADSVAALAVRAQGGQIITTATGRELLILTGPGGQTMQEVTDPHGLIPGVPARIAQRVTLQTVDSLVDYAERFKTDTTLLFADITTNSISALIDYHGAADPQNVDHRATMALPFSSEWAIWTGASGKLLEQLEFARFLEENAADIAAPSGADLLETVRDLQARRKVDFRKAVRTASDNENFEYTDNTTATTKNGGVEVPSKFLLKIPVYFGDPPTEVYAFLRWKLEEANLKLGIVLHRAEQVRQAVFKQIVLDAAERTSRSAVFGKAA